MNTEQHEEQQLEVESIHPGKALRNARIALGLSEQDVADRLRLRISVIHELEENCCDDNQIATFTRGYIRSYAKLVGLDADALLKNYQVAPQAEENAQKMQSFSRKTRREKHDSRVMGLTWVILAAAVGLTSFWWWQKQQNEQIPTLLESNVVEGVEVSEALPPIDSLEVGEELSSSADTPQREVTVEPILPARTSNEKEVLNAQATAPNQPQREAVEDTPAVKEQVVANDAVTSVGSSEQTIASAALPTLTLSFDGDCWVDIRDGSGKRLLTGIKSAGETVDLSGQAPFKIVLGAPTAVNVEYNGEKVDLSGFPSGRVARLSLPK